MWNIHNDDIGTIEEREIVFKHIHSLNDVMNTTSFVLPDRYNGKWWKLFDEYKTYLELLQIKKPLTIHVNDCSFNNFYRFDIFNQ
jgi:hypothetical protein